jgi:hypothetical protein
MEAAFLNLSMPYGQDQQGFLRATSAGWPFALRGVGVIEAFSTRLMLPTCRYLS